MAPTLRTEILQHLERHIRRFWYESKQVRKVLAAAEAANEHVEPCIHRADLSGGERCPCHQRHTYLFTRWTPERTTSYRKAARYDGTDQEFVEAIIRAHGEISQRLDVEDAANAADT